MGLPWVLVGFPCSQRLFLEHLHEQGQRGGLKQDTYRFTPLEVLTFPLDIEILKIQGKANRQFMIKVKSVLQRVKVLR